MLDYRLKSLELFYKLPMPDFGPDLSRREGGKTAYGYLTGRGLSEETIRKFGLGYSDKYSDDLYKYLKGKGYSDELLRESGLFNVDERRGMYDKFWNRVIFPIMDVNNRVIGLEVVSWEMASPST